MMSPRIMRKAYKESIGATPFDVEAYLALGRANADKLPTGVAEALGPEPVVWDWADKLVRELWPLMGDFAASEKAKVLRSRCRPIGNDTVTDEATRKELRRVASIFAQWRSTLMLQKMDGEQWRSLNKAFDDLFTIAARDSASSDAVDAAADCSTINQVFDWLKEGEKSRDTGSSFSGHASSLAHQLHSYGWVKRDLQLALCVAKPSYGKDQLRCGNVTESQIGEAK